MRACVRALGRCYSQFFPDRELLPQASGRSLSKVLTLGGVRCLRLRGSAHTQQVAFEFMLTPKAHRALDFHITWLVPHRGPASA